MRRMDFRRLGSLDLPGSGQVVVSGNICAVGHMDPPLGTTILDVGDPTRPRVLAQLPVPEDTHSHKVRIHGDLMLVNYEAYRGAAGTLRGFGVFDISDPADPRQISMLEIPGRGVHRFDFDGRFAYLSAGPPGYKGNIVIIYDLAEPSRPKEVSRWWLPGQWVEGGETPNTDKRHEVHHPLRFGDRLYVSCVFAGFAILDASDLQNLKVVARHPVHGLYNHTAMPLAPAADGRDLVFAVDEGWWGLEGGVATVDITDRAAPRLLASHFLPEGSGKAIWATHQPHERIIDNVAFVAWFGHGLRAVDVSNPLSLVEIGSYGPRKHGDEAVSSNDVYADETTNRAYVVDRVRGLDIVEWETL